MQILECGTPGAPDPEAWDRFVAGDPSGHLLQTWAWGDLKAAFGWRARRLAVERDGALLAGAQILYRRFGPLSVAYVPKGPVLCDDSDDVARALWAAVHRDARRSHAVFIKVEPPWRDSDPCRHEWLARYGFQPSDATIQPRRTIVVDLTPDEDTLLAKMKSKWRYNIRLAERKGVLVKQVGAEGVPTFYDLMRITAERDEFGIHSAAYFHRALELFAPSGRAALFLAYLDGEPLAGLMAFAFHGRAWYMYGASSNRHRETMPNHRLQWHAMLWAKAKGCREYDLWGIPDVDPDSHALAGVGRFKEGFGGEAVRFVGAYDYAYSPVLMRVAGLLRSLRRSLG